MVYINHLREQYTIEDPTKFFLFNQTDPSKPVHANVLGYRLKKIAKQAGVEINMYPHAFRATLAVKLHRAKNDISTISKFIGHTSAATTSEYYLLLGAKDLADSVNNPFMSTYRDKKEEKQDYEEENDLQRKKVASALHIIHAYNNILTTAMKANPDSELMLQIKQQLSDTIPDLHILINCIASSINDASSSTSSTFSTSSISSMSS